MNNMGIYDDKTNGIIKVGNHFFLNTVGNESDVTFKASYIVGSGLHIDGNITASFDLIVLGDVVAQDVDIKGRFVCVGNCTISNSLTVQGKMTCDRIRAKNIEVHDDIVAQEIDVNVLNVDGNIIVGQTLAIESSAKSSQKILCGETAYGAGTISALEIITGDTIDMDGGTEAIIDPDIILLNREKHADTLDNKYAAINDYKSYLAELRKNSIDKTLKSALSRWEKALNETSLIVKQKDTGCSDMGILLSLIELSNSSYFSDWNEIEQWKKHLLEKFNKMANGEGVLTAKTFTVNDLKTGLKIKHKLYGIGIIRNIKKDSIVMATVAFENGRISNFNMDLAMNLFTLVEDRALSAAEIVKSLFIRPNGYGEWLTYLNILRLYGENLSKKLYDIAIKQLYSLIGIKSKYMSDRLQENGWKYNV